MSDHEMMEEGTEKPKQERIVLRRNISALRGIEYAIPRLLADADC